MIHVLVGENALARDQAIERLAGDSEVERFSGDRLEQSDIADIFMGQTLFSTQRVVVVDHLSTNKSIWQELDVWFARLDNTTTLILVEMTLDKRTKTYKLLQKESTIVQCDFWRADRDKGIAKQWLTGELQAHAVTIDGALVDELIGRSVRPSLVDTKPIIDQVRLQNVVRQLAAWTGPVTVSQIDTIMEPDMSENVFGLLSAALDGSSDKLQQMCERLRKNEDGFKVFGLLVSQVVNILALVSARDRSVDQIAADTALNTFALRSLSGHTRSMDMRRARHLLEVTAAADNRIKRGREPWSIIESMLQKIALS